jgi:cell division protease FtsH
MSIKKNTRNFAFWAIVILLLSAFFNIYYGGGRQEVRKLPYSEFSHLVNDGKVKEVLIQGFSVAGRLKEGQAFTTYLPVQDNHIIDQLKKNDVKIESTPQEGYTFLGFLLSFVPILLMVGAWLFIFRQMQGGGKTFSFGKSKAKINENQTITFNDVAGAQEAKENLKEIVDFLKDPEKYQKIGGRIPRGVLLVGPPGTGKTLLAKAVAGEANATFFSVSGSDFVEMFVGVGASRVRDMFAQARAKSPAIIFVDEIDAVARKRGTASHGGHDEREQTLNQFLVEMDGFDTKDGVIVIAATNRSDVLDKALLRPGRFDRQILVDLPDLLGREEILRVHGKKVSLDPDVDLKVIARGTPGFSGADLANLINEAALSAARSGMDNVTMSTLEESKDKILMGAPRSSLVMTDKEKKLTAYHEAGHAVVAFHSPLSDPIHKATIVPRGHALGMVVRLPENDQISLPLTKINTDLAVAMAGRVAEELIFGKEMVTTGASSDFRFASHYARKMVLEWGMSPLGPLHLEEEGGVFGTQKSFSEKTSEMVDKEVHRILEKAYSQAKNLLIKHNEQLVLLAEALLKKETLTGEEIKKLFSRKKPTVRTKRKTTEKEGKSEERVNQKTSSKEAPEGSGGPEAGKEVGTPDLSTV